MTRTAMLEAQRASVSDTGLGHSRATWAGSRRVAWSWAGARDLHRQRQGWGGPVDSACVRWGGPRSPSRRGFSSA
jgi:hypothetical protein